MGNQDREEGDGEAAVQEFGKGIKFMLPKCCLSTYYFLTMPHPDHDWLIQ
jgi:hypothetical protein